MPFSHGRNRDPYALTPLKPIELLVLTMLSAGDRHGYGIRQDILAFTNGRISLEAGNLYRHIRNLEADGLVEEVGARPAAPGDDERRIYYRLRAFGRRVLAAEVTRLRDVVLLAEANGVVPQHA
jgi:DNA-binding PadR family transcriptional regulator